MALLRKGRGGQGAKSEREFIDKHYAENDETPGSAGGPPVAEFPEC